MQRFIREKDLQAHVKRVLQANGIPVQEEVTNGAVRADLVTPNAVIECKLTLTRESIYNALGQATVYQRNLGKPIVWLVGQLPIDYQQRAQALRIANEVRSENIYVSFIELDAYWHSAPPQRSPPSPRTVPATVQTIDVEPAVYPVSPLRSFVEQYRFVLLAIGCALLALSVPHLFRCHALPQATSYECK